MSSRQMLARSMLVIALTGTADADTLFTPAISAAGKRVFLVCSAVNVSDQTKTIRVETNDSQTGLTMSSTESDVAPGQAISTAVRPSPHQRIDAYCMITVDGKKTTVRGAAYIFDTKSGTTMGSVPAQ